MGESGDLSTEWWHVALGVVVCVLGQLGIGGAYIVKRWVALRARTRREMLEGEDDDSESDDGYDGEGGMGGPSSSSSSSSSSSYSGWNATRWRAWRLCWSAVQMRVRSWWWWLSVLLLLGGETLNFAAYLWLPASAVAVLNGLNVVVGVLGGALLLREQFDWRLGVGATLALGGMAGVLVLEALDATRTLTSFDAVARRLQQPWPVAYLCLIGLAVASGMVFAAAQQLRLQAQFRRSVVWTVLVVYAATAAWSVTNTKAVGLMLTTGVHEVTAYAVLVVPWWLSVVAFQLWLIDWAYAEGEVGTLAPLMYSSYATVALITAQVIFQELQSLRAAWHLAVALVCFALAVGGVALVATRHARV